MRPRNRPTKSQLITFLEQWITKQPESNWTLLHDVIPARKLSEDQRAVLVEMGTRFEFSAEEIEKMILANEQEQKTASVVIVRDDAAETCLVPGIHFLPGVDFREDDPANIEPALEPGQQQTLARFAQYLVPHSANPPSDPTKR